MVTTCKVLPSLSFSAKYSIKLFIYVAELIYKSTVLNKTMIVDLNNKNTEIVVVGGGTAGWLTALYIQNFYPDVSITVIESSEIGIIGAGEGTTPHFTRAMEELGIKTNDIVKHADATVKNGIKFTNWNGDGDYYYHGFDTVKDLNYQSIFNMYYCQDNLLALETIAKGDNFNNIEFVAHVCEKDAVVIAKYEDRKTKNLTFSELSNFALHINAIKLAEFLRDVGEERGIKVVDGIVDKINEDVNGNITYLTLQNGKNITCDFVFDCTGLKRLIIGNHYKSEWQSFKEYLPLNRAIPFFADVDKDRIPPYTESIAMKYGWAWKIPLQGRYGCGYVFDKNYLTDEQAIAEIKERFGEDVYIPEKSFSFEPGVYKQQWIKNCVAIGLASGFVEPLEATNIWVTILSLRNILTRIKGITDRNETSINLFNETMLNISDDVMSFLHYHYLTQRIDTKFWRDFRDNCKTPNNLKKLIDSNYDFTVINDISLNSLFVSASWQQVGAGLKIFNKEEANNSFNALIAGMRGGNYKTIRDVYLTNIKQMSEKCIDHKELIPLLLNFKGENSDQLQHRSHHHQHPDSLIYQPNLK